MDLFYLLEKLSSKYDADYVDFSFGFTGEESFNFYLSVPPLSSKQILGNVSCVDGVFRVAIMIFEDIEDSLETYKKINKFNINFPEYKLFVSPIIGVDVLYFVYASSDINYTEQAIEKFDYVLSDFYDEDIMKSLIDILKK